MAIDTKKLTYEEYLAMPEMKCRYEIINGELMMAASPIPIHQWIVGNVYRVLHTFVSLHRLGIVLMGSVSVSNLC
jgi:Uma2 family endonuclease